MEPAIDILGLLFVVAVFAGIIDGVAGGGGLITLPVLLMTGLSPAQAIATNKIQALSSVASSAYGFAKAGKINAETIKPKIIAAVIGAALGALCIQLIDPKILSVIAPVILIAVALFFLFWPKLVHLGGHGWISEGAFAIFCAFPIGFYDGFFGPGTGAIYAATFVLALGRDLQCATAETKALNAAGSLVAALIFLPGGAIAWAPALAMAAGAIIGGRIGAHIALKWGAPLIRAGLVLISLLLALRLLLS